MDPNQFDDLVARISNALTRRDAVKGLSVGALTSAGIGTVAADSADAAKKGRGDAKKGRGRGKKGRSKKGRENDAGGEGKGKNNNNRAKKCKKGRKHCGNKKKCFNLQTSSQHCGNCGTRCATGQFCSNGVCVNAT